MDILNNDAILNMYDQLEVSVAIIDRDLKIIYLNQAAQKFYGKIFGERNYLGYSTKQCHSEVNQKNIEALFMMFDMGKKMNFYHMHFPQAEGGDVTVLQFPYTVNGKIEGMIELNIESSLAPGGRGEYQRVFEK